MEVPYKAALFPRDVVVRIAVVYGSTVQSCLVSTWCCCQNSSRVWHLSYDISCPFYVLLLLPRGVCPTFSFWLGARTLGFCNGMCYQLSSDLQLLAEVRGQLSFCNGAGARVFAWLSLLRFVWAYFMGFSFAHIHFQYLLFPVMPLLVY